MQWRAPATSHGRGSSAPGSAASRTLGSLAIRPRYVRADRRISLPHWPRRKPPILTPLWRSCVQNRRKDSQDGLQARTSKAPSRRRVRSLATTGRFGRSVLIKPGPDRRSMASGWANRAPPRRRRREPSSPQEIRSPSPISSPSGSPTSTRNTRRTWRARSRRIPRRGRPWKPRRAVRRQGRQTR